MKTKDLIYYDITRCNNDKCHAKEYCARFKQLQIDIENKNNRMSVVDFKDGENKGLCQHFLSIEKY